MANANIFAQFARPVRSMQEYGADYDVAEQNKLALAAKRMDMQKAERGMADDQAVRGIVQQHGSDKNALVKALYGGGYASQAQGIEKSIQDKLKSDSDIASTDAATQVKKYEAASKRIELAGSVFKQVMDNPSAESAIRAADFLGQNGVWDQAAVQKAIAEVQANPTPEAVLTLAQRAYQGALNAKDQLPQYFKQGRGGTEAIVSVNPVTGQTSDVQTAQVTQTPDSIARSEDAAKSRAQSAAQHGATIGLQRERLAFDKEDSVRKMDEKPLNDTQSKALLFGSRMREADKVLESLAKSGTKASVPGSRAGYGVGSVVTALSSSQQQQLDQAKRDFLSAVLRRESGAVISDSEFDNGDKQYFPQIGDSKEVISQKARNRKLATDGILQEVPEKRRNGLQPTPQMSTVDDVRKQADNILKGG